MKKTSQSKPVNVALIGQQFMGRAHANAWGQVNRFFEPRRPAILHTVAARDARTLAPFAARFGFRRWTTDWREIARDEEVDLVDVATPNDAHAEASIAMLEAGKHVACEKPLARTLSEAREMLRAARKSQRKTFVWFNYRRCPAVALAYQFMREGRLGRLYHVRARYLQSWGGPRTPHSWRFERQRAGSGAHGDLNAHIVDMARFLVGEEMIEIHGAVARTFIRERAVPEAPKRAARKRKSEVDDAVLFLASFTGGATASFEATRLATGNLNAHGIELNGERGSLRFEFEDMNVLWYYDAALEPRTQGWRRIVCTSAAGAHPYVAHWWPDAHLLGYEHGFTNMAADVLRVLAREKPEVPLPDFADAYQTQRVLDAALVSARERAAVKLSSIV